MSFLTFTKGATTIIVDVSASGGATERDSRRVGETVDVFSGGLSSSVSAEYREWEWPAAMMTAAAYEALRALVALDVIVTVDGDALAGVGPIPAIVRVSGGSYVPDVRDPLGYKRRAILTVKAA